MRSTIDTQRLRIQPGTPATIEIDVVNTSSVIDGVTAVVHGLDAAQVRMEPPVVTLFPESTGRLALIVDVPPSFPAGDMMVLVRLNSTVNDEPMSEHDLWLTVEPVEAAELRLRPSLVNGGRSAELDAEVHNTGNVTTEFAVGAVEPTRALSCRTSPATVVVPPGESRPVRVHAAGPRPWFSQTLARSIQITAASPTITLQETARFNQKPRIPRGVITALVLASIIALWAFIFLFVVQLLRAGGDPKKAVPASWNAGDAQELSLANVAGSVTGRVSAGTTGEGIPRITVAAYRVASNGESSEQSASTATGDDGTYTLTPLLPGSYRLRFSADGFDPIWFPAAADQADAEVLDVAPKTPLAGKDIVLNGQPGKLTGKIGAPAGGGGGGGGGGGAATITITLVPSSPDQEVPPPKVVESTGEFSVDGLPTPATYSVRVERPGFEAQTFTVELGGGANTVLDTAQLTASTGGIQGVVVDGNGTPLGGVTVTVRSGAIEQISTTPTAGAVGSFDISGLPTPRTYVLTFTLDGFSSATIALDLGGGETRSGLTAKLVGGAGTVRGTARDVNGNPLGGVQVVVTRGDLSATTTTLTSGSGANGIGTYTIANLPTPGVYSVTFTLDGYETETQSVGFLGAGEQGGIDVTMRTTAGKVTGTVRLGTAGRAGATVVLSDGLTTRTTTTSSNPSGAFEFPNVAPGSYTLRVSGPGITTRVVLMKVGDGQPVDRTIIVAAAP